MTSSSTARTAGRTAASTRWLRDHPGATPGQVAGLADRLWNAGIREEQLVACFLLARDRAALAATDPRRVLAWTGLLDNWETTDQLGMNVLGPLVALDPGGRLGLLAELAGDPHPWSRRLALVACTRWPADARPVVAAGAGELLSAGRDREAALPKASSGCCAAGWGRARRRWRRSSTPTPGGCRPGRPGDQGKLATGTKRPPRRPPPAGERP